MCIHLACLCSLWFDALQEKKAPKIVLILYSYIKMMRLSS